MSKRYASMPSLILFPKWFKYVSYDFFLLIDLINFYLCLGTGYCFWHRWSCQPFKFIFRSSLLHEFDFTIKCYRCKLRFIIICPHLETHVVFYCFWSILCNPDMVTWLLYYVKLNFKLSFIIICPHLETNIVFCCFWFILCDSNMVR